MGIRKIRRRIEIKTVLLMAFIEDLLEGLRRRHLSIILRPAEAELLFTGD
jgi:hypothetical protein